MYDVVGGLSKGGKVSNNNKVATKVSSNDVAKSCGFC